MKTRAETGLSLKEMVSCHHPFCCTSNDNSSKHLLTMCQHVCILIHLILTTILWGRYYCHLHFTDEDTESHSFKLVQVCSASKRQSGSIVCSSNSDYQSACTNPQSAHCPCIFHYIWLHVSHYANTLTCSGLLEGCFYFSPGLHFHNFLSKIFQTITMADR